MAIKVLLSSLCYRCLFVFVKTKSDTKQLPRRKQESPQKDTTQLKSNETGREQSSKQTCNILVKDEITSFKKKGVLEYKGYLGIFTLKLGNKYLAPVFFWFPFKYTPHLLVRRDTSF